MENIKKFDIKSFVAGGLLVGIVMGGGMYYMNYNYENNLKGYITLEQHKNELNDIGVTKEKYDKDLAEAKAYTPEIVYKTLTSAGVPGIGIYSDYEIVPKMAFSDWFNKYELYYNLPYFRAVNKKYLITNGGPNGYLENQLEFTFNKNLFDNESNKKFFDKCNFEQELKKYTDKKFAILNIGNFNQNQWIIDFDSKVTKDEMNDIKLNILKDLKYKFDPIRPPLYIGYNSILLPEYFNDKGFGKEMNNNYNLNL